MENKLFELYTLAELSYESLFKNIVKDRDELYPIGWYETKNYQEKIEILSEAIKKNKLIVNTKSYQKIIEGITTKTKGLVI